jgi:hypothetical protein
MAEHLPALMEETAVEAKSRDERCRTCQGTGRITKDDVELECTRCEGKGTVHILGSVDRLKLVFDTFGLTGKAGGPLVAIDLRGKPGKGESLADLAGSLDGIVTGTGRIKDDDAGSEPVQ